MLRSSSPLSISPRQLESTQRMQSDLDAYLGSRHPPKNVGVHGTSKDGRKDEQDAASIASPSARSAAHQNKAMMELLRRVLEKREGNEGRPKAKEAESIKPNNMPTPETYRHWKTMYVKRFGRLPTNRTRHGLG